jgi:hypothetical protein
MTNTSIDPTQWKQVSEGPWSKRRKHQSVVWGENLLILGGFDGEAAFDLNDVWSFNGHSWELIVEHAGWSGRDGHCSVVLNGSIFVLGGTDDPFNCKCDVWRSDDGGYEWLLVCPYAPWPERWQHAACVHDSKIYVIGGWGDRYLNDVWSSPDGINWTEECSNAPWRSRMFLSVIDFNDLIYVIGGHDGRMQLRDVWASSDGGKSWTQVCQSAQWEGRQGHATVALDGHVYLMGGFGGAARFNDLWKSSDCSHWTLVTRHCNWTPRQGHACLSYHGSIYITGGFDESGYCNNVYSLRVSEETVCDTIVKEVVLGGLSNQVSNIKTGAKQITVSMICILESIDLLRAKRFEREKLVQQIVGTVGLVMKTINVSAESLGNIKGNKESISCSSDAADHTVSLVPNPEGAPPLVSERKEASPRMPSASTDHLVPLLSGPLDGGPVGLLGGVVGNDLSLDLPAPEKPVSNSSRCGSKPPILSPLSQNGSPFREQLKVSGVPTKGIKSDEDLHMRFWQILPQSPPGPSHKSLQVDPNQVSKMDSGPSVGSIRVSSAALRESMEKDRTKLSMIQRNIRVLAERGEVEKIDAKVAERTMVAVRSVSLAGQLYEHVRSVRLMQDQRQQFLSSTLYQLESLILLITPVTEEVAVMPNSVSNREQGNDDIQLDRASAQGFEFN